MTFVFSSLHIILLSIRMTHDRVKHLGPSSFDSIHMRMNDGKKPLEVQGIPLNTSMLHTMHLTLDREVGRFRQLVQATSRSCRFLSSLFPAMPRIVHSSQCWHQALVQLQLSRSKTHTDTLLFALIVAMIEALSGRVLQIYQVTSINSLAHA